LWKKQTTQQIDLTTQKQNKNKHPKLDDDCGENKEKQKQTKNK